MGKNVRRGRTGSVRCASCGQLTRRDRSVYLFKNTIKSYYCPDCAKKIHGSRLYKGIPKFVRRRSAPRVKRKFAVYSTSDQSSYQMEENAETNERASYEENSTQTGSPAETTTTKEHEETNEDNQQ